MKEKKTWAILILLIFGAACFGGGVLYGQSMLKNSGFVYEEGAASEAAPPAEVPSVVNINTASAEELEAIDGIGPVTAEKILQSRESDGDFLSTEELLTRGVIGKSKWESVKEFLTVE